MVTNEYYTILTKIGIARFIAARASGIGVDVKSFKLSSKVILPSEDMQNLEEIVYEASINNKYIDPQNDCYVNLECYIPSNVGGFEINSIGIYDNEENLLAVGNLPRTYKPLLSEGSAKELMVRVVMELSNADKVILKLDPSVIMASRDYVNKLETNLRVDLAKILEELAKKENTGVAKNLDEALKAELLKLINAKENIGVAKNLNEALKKEFSTKIEQAVNLTHLKFKVKKPIFTLTSHLNGQGYDYITLGHINITDDNGKVISDDLLSVLSYKSIRYSNNS